MKDCCVLNRTTLSENIILKNNNIEIDKFLEHIPEYDPDISGIWRPIFIPHETISGIVKIKDANQVGNGSSIKQSASIPFKDWFIDINGSVDYGIDFFVNCNKNNVFNFRDPELYQKIVTEKTQGSIPGSIYHKQDIKISEYILPVTVHISGFIEDSLVVNDEIDVECKEGQALYPPDENGNCNIYNPHYGTYNFEYNDISFSVAVQDKNAEFASYDLNIGYEPKSYASLLCWYRYYNYDPQNENDNRPIKGVDIYIPDGDCIRISSPNPEYYYYYSSIELSGIAYNIKKSLDTYNINAMMDPNTIKYLANLLSSGPQFDWVSENLTSSDNGINYPRDEYGLIKPFLSGMSDKVYSDIGKNNYISSKVQLFKKLQDKYNSQFIINENSSIKLNSKFKTKTGSNFSIDLNYEVLPKNFGSAPKYDLNVNCGDLELKIEKTDEIFTGSMEDPDTKQIIISEPYDISYIKFNDKTLGYTLTNSISGTATEINNIKFHGLGGVNISNTNFHSCVDNSGLYIVTNEDDTKKVYINNNASYSGPWFLDSYSNVPQEGIINSAYTNSLGQYIQYTGIQITYKTYENTEILLNNDLFNIDYLRTEKTPSCLSFVSGSCECYPLIRLSSDANTKELLDNDNFYIPALSSYHFPSGYFYGGLSNKQIQEINVYPQDHPEPGTLLPKSHSPINIENCSYSYGEGLNPIYNSYSQGIGVGLKEFALKFGQCSSIVLNYSISEGSGIFKITDHNDTTNSIEKIVNGSTSGLSCLHLPLNRMSNDIDIYASGSHYWRINVIPNMDYIQDYTPQYVTIQAQKGFFHPNSGWLNNIFGKTAVIPMDNIKDSGIIKHKFNIDYNSEKIYKDNNYFPGSNYLFEASGNRLELIKKAKYIGFSTNLSSSTYLIGHRYPYLDSVYPFFDIIKYDETESPIMEPVKFDYTAPIKNNYSRTITIYSKNKTEMDDYIGFGKWGNITWNNFFKNDFSYSNNTNRMAKTLSTIASWGAPMAFYGKGSAPVYFAPMSRLFVDIDESEVKTYIHTLNYNSSSYNFLSDTDQEGDAIISSGEIIYGKSGYIYAGPFGESETIELSIKLYIDGTAGTLIPFVNPNPPLDFIKGRIRMSTLSGAIIYDKKIEDIENYSSFADEIKIDLNYLATPFLKVEYIPDNGYCIFDKPYRFDGNGNILWVNSDGVTNNYLYNTYVGIKSYKLKIKANYYNLKNINRVRYYTNNELFINDKDIEYASSTSGSNPLYFQQKYLLEKNKEYNPYLNLSIVEFDKIQDIPSSGYMYFENFLRPVDKSLIQNKYEPDQYWLNLPEHKHHNWWNILTNKNILLKSNSKYVILKKLYFDCYLDAQECSERYLYDLCSTNNYELSKEQLFESLGITEFDQQFIDIKEVSFPEYCSQITYCCEEFENKNNPDITDGCIKQQTETREECETYWKDKFFSVLCKDASCPVTNLSGILAPSVEYFVLTVNDKIKDYVNFFNSDIKFFSSNVYRPDQTSGPKLPGTNIENSLYSSNSIYLKNTQSQKTDKQQSCSYIIDPEYSSYVNNKYILAFDKDRGVGTSLYNGSNFIDITSLVLGNTFVDYPLPSSLILHNERQYRLAYDHPNRISPPLFDEYDRNSENNNYLISHIFNIKSTECVSPGSLCSIEIDGLFCDFYVSYDENYTRIYLNSSIFNSVLLKEKPYEDVDLPICKGLGCDGGFSFCSEEDEDCDTKWYCLGPNNGFGTHFYSTDRCVSEEEACAKAKELVFEDKGWDDGSFISCKKMGIDDIPVCVSCAPCGAKPWNHDEFIEYNIPCFTAFSYIEEKPQECYCPDYAKLVTVKIGGADEQRCVYPPKINPKTGKLECGIGVGFAGQQPIDGNGNCFFLPVCFDPHRDPLTYDDCSKYIYQSEVDNCTNQNAALKGWKESCKDGVEYSLKRKIQEVITIKNYPIPTDFVINECGCNDPDPTLCTVPSEYKIITRDVYVYYKNRQIWNKVDDPPMLTEDVKAGHYRIYFNQQCESIDQYGTTQPYCKEGDVCCEGICIPNDAVCCNNKVDINFNVKFDIYRDKIVAYLNNNINNKFCYTRPNKDSFKCPNIRYSKNNDKILFSDSVSSYCGGCMLGEI